MVLIQKAELLRNHCGLATNSKAVYPPVVGLQIIPQKELHSVEVKHRLLGVEEVITKGEVK